MDWWENSLSTAPQTINVIPVDESYDGVKCIFQFGQICLTIKTNINVIFPVIIIIIMIK